MDNQSHSICQTEAENHSTEPSKKFENKTVLGPDGSMYEIRTDSTGREWIDIGGVKKWRRHCPICGVNIWTKSKDLLSSNHRCKTCGYKKRSEKTKIKYTSADFQRQCPKCGRVLTYLSVHGCRAASRRGAVCVTCQSSRASIQNMGKTMPIDVRNKISKTLTGRVFSDETKRKLSDIAKKRKKIDPNFQCGNRNSMFGKYRFGKDNPNYGRKWTDEMRNRHSRISLEKVKDRGGIFHAYNKTACTFFDELSKKNGWNLQHAENGGEFFVHRYYVDAYDKTFNIVVEYDESHHYVGGNLRPKDIDRMNTIINTLKCQFWRYNQTTNTLTQYA